MVAYAYEEPYYNAVVEAHGIMGCLAWVIFFPLAAILIRVVPGPKAWIVHAAVALFALALFTANASMGIWQAYTYTEGHQILGLILFSMAWLQPIGGFVHHFLYVKYERRTIVSFLHIAVGRAIITVGMINGGLGILLGGDADHAERIVYGVIAGVIWVTYLTIAFVSEHKREAARSNQFSNGKIYE